jgi:hypothetical protein
MTPKQILSILTPELLFSRSNYKAEYRDLAKIYHPDSGGSELVMSHINYLCALAVAKDRDNNWATPSAFGQTTLKHGKFELGDFYITPTALYFDITHKYKDKLTRYDYQVLTKYSSACMKDEIQRFLPKSIAITKSDKLYSVVIPKLESQLRLADVLTYFNGHLDPKHVAWIISGLCNLLCYFSWAEITHNGITSKNVYIDPEKHSVHLLGGWFYAVPCNQRLLGMPAKVYEVTPAGVKANKTASLLVDKESVRALGRELLGDRLGANLTMVPDPMKMWLVTPGDPNAVKDYANWIKALEESFGPRKFTELQITSNDLYGD